MYESDGCDLSEWTGELAGWTDISQVTNNETNGKKPKVCVPVPAKNSINVCKTSIAVAVLGVAAGAILVFKKRK